MSQCVLVRILWGNPISSRSCFCSLQLRAQGWIEDIKATQGVSEFDYPIIADEKRDLAVKFGMVDPGERDVRPFELAQYHMAGRARLRTSVWMFARLHW